MLVDVERPLRVGEVVAESLRAYIKRPVPFLLVGVLQAGAFAVALLDVTFGGAIAVVSLGFVVSFIASTLILFGVSLRDALQRCRQALPTLVVLVLIVGVPATLGRIDPLLFLISIGWLALTACAVPASLLERSDLRYALVRTLNLARSNYFHALAVVFVLVLVELLVGLLLAGALHSFGDNTRDAAIAIVQVVLAPFYFIGLGVLYADQAARVAEAEGPRR